MRYLLACIDQHATSHRNKELKLILAEARDGADEKNAILEFYETLERITNELRNTTEHSTAFLNKVRKAEAPNYYEVIKKPMDLGTVLKKVKGQQYKDKASFAADLDLIWSNCLEYNSMPGHPLRHAALELRKRANNALQYVSDITKPSYGTPLGRDTPDAEGDSDEEIEPDDTGATRKGTVSRKRGTQEANKSRARATSEAAGSQVEEEVDDAMSRDSSPVSQGIRGASLARSRRTLTAKTDLIPFEERPALVRTRDGMTRFLEAEAQPLDEAPIPSTSAMTLDMPAPSSRASVSPASKPLPLPLQALLPKTSRPALPKSEPMTASLSTESERDPLQSWWESSTNATMLANGWPRCRFIGAEGEKQLEPVFEDDGSGLAIPIAANLVTLREIKMRRTELLGLQVDIMEADEAAQPDLAPTLPFSPPVSLRHANADVAASTALRSVCIALLAHAGFDAVSADAVNVLLALASRLLGNLGRSARVLYDRVGARVPAETLAVAVLEDNGVAHPAELERYVDRGIIGYGNQLQEVLQRLRNVDSLAPGSSYELVDPLAADQPAAPRFQPPPAHVPFDETGIESQIGLLQPVYKARLATEHALHDDDVDPVRTKVFRPKVPPSGKIPTKRRAEKETAAGMGKKAKKQKKVTTAGPTSAAIASSPSKMDIDEE